MTALALPRPLCQNDEAHGYTRCRGLCSGCYRRLRDREVRQGTWVPRTNRGPLPMRTEKAQLAAMWRRCFND